MSVDTQVRIEQQQQKYQKKSLKLKKYQLESEVQKLNRQRIIQVLEEEQKSWLNQDNIDALNDKILLPDQIFDETDYYLKLQQEALLYTQARYDELEELNNQELHIAKQNRLLVPLYGEVKQLIKELKNTPLNKLKREYEVNRAILKKEGKAQEDFDKLNSAFNVIVQQLITSQKEKQIENLYNELLKVYNLLQKWAKYTEVLRMNSTMIEQLIAEEKEALNPIKKANQKSSAKTEEEQKVTYAENLQEGIDENFKTEDLIDFEKQKQKDAQFKEQMLKDFEKFQQNKEINSEKSSDSDLDKMMEDLDKNKEQLEKEFEEAKKSGETVLYFETDSVMPVDEFLKDFSIEKNFPKQLIEEAASFQPNLIFKTFYDIEQNEQTQKVFESQRANPDQQKLRTSIVCQVYKDKLKQLQSRDNLSRKQKNQLQEISKMIEIISEKSVQEPRFLAHVWNSL